MLLYDGELKEASLMGSASVCEVCEGFCFLASCLIPHVMYQHLESPTSVEPPVFLLELIRWTWSTTRSVHDDSNGSPRKAR
jgi:hypothetical protein